MGRDEIEPMLGYPISEKSVPMELPLLSGDFFEEITEYSSLREKQLILRHENFRSKRNRDENNGVIA